MERISAIIVATVLPARETNLVAIVLMVIAGYGILMVKDSIKPNGVSTG